MFSILLLLSYTTALTQLVKAHPIWACIFLYFIFSNAIGAMEKPTEKSGPWYRWFYRFSHGLAGNLKYALRTKFPTMVEPDTQTQTAAQ